MAEAQDVNTLKRRGRRRLVGAIALVLLAVIVLPMVFDSEPRQPPTPVEVRIPSESTSFKPKLPARPASEAREAAPAASKSTEPAGHTAGKSAVPHKPSVAASKKAPQPSAAERARAEAALAGIEYIVPVAALADPERVKELTSRLAAAKLPYYTEPVATAKGPVTRVRAGPFDSREAAEKAHAKLKGLGLKPGNVTTKS
jgi:DedD protein